MDEIPSPLPPRNVFRSEEKPEERSPLVVLALQFFVIPLLIVLFCVVLFLIFRWLTYERRDVGDYLNSLHAGSASRRQEAAASLLGYIQEAKRWQSLSDLNDRLRFDREKFLAENPDFPSRIVAAFRQARGADPKVAQYLSQVLSLVGGPEASEALLEALKEGGAPDQEIFVMIGLGKLGDARSVPLILERLSSDDAGVRYAALFALGFLEDERSITALRAALHDPDPLATWNAAFSLARLSAKTGRLHPEAVPVLERLLDRGFVEKVAEGREGGRSPVAGPVLNPAQIELYRVRAVQLLGIFLNDAIRKDLQTVADKDTELSVRQAALDVLRGGKDQWREMEAVSN